MFYEDTSLKIDPYVDQNHLVSFVSTLHNLLQALKIFEGRLEEKDRMLHFLREKYGNNHDVVGLLAFYEDYYRDVKKPQEERDVENQKARWKTQQDQKDVAKQAENKQTKSEKNTQEKHEPFDEDIFPVPYIQLRRESKQAWLKRFQDILKKQAVNGNSQSQVELSYHQVRKANGTEPGKASLELNGNSYGIFVQFYKEKNVDGQEKLMGVLNSSFSGFGKMFSRFLHIYEDVSEDVKKWNRALARDKLFIEDCDASYFNANLHPPLMPYEIWMPGSHNSLQPEQQIPVTDLQIRIDGKSDELKLVHSPSGKQIHVFDLGFQGHAGRSPLYRLLETFTAVEYLSYYPLITGLRNHLNDHNDAKEQNEKTAAISFIPRVVYEGQIVLKRKTWFVPKALLPFKQPGEGRWQYFLRVNRWRIEQNIPDEIFVVVNPDPGNRQGNAKDPEDHKKLGRDDYKPQYICFRNPLLINLFEKLIQKVPEFLKIEEMLPNSQQLLALGESRRVTEFVVQWYTNMDENEL